MPEDKPFQIGFPLPGAEGQLTKQVSHDGITTAAVVEPGTLAETPTQQPAGEMKESHGSKFYNLRPGTIVFDNPPANQHRTEITLAKWGRGRQLGKANVTDGYVSLQVEFESPPEMKGKTGWVTLNPGKGKGRGFVRET